MVRTSPLRLRQLSVLGLIGETADIQGPFGSSILVLKDLVKLWSFESMRRCEEKHTLSDLAGVSDVRVIQDSS